MQQQNFSFKKLLFPFTNVKAIFWITSIGCFAFANMLFNQFIEDDKKYIINYFPQLQHITLAFLFGPNSFNIAGQYRPLPATYFSLLYFFFTTTPFFYHIVQLILHIGVTILLYILFQKFLSRGVAFFGAVIFLIHPMQVESVAYIAQTVSPLLAIFGLSAFLTLTKKTVTSKDIWIGCLLILLTLLTKETGVIFIFLILLYRAFLIRKNLIKLLLGLSGTFLIYIFLRVAVGHVGLVTRILVPIADMSVLQRLINLPLIFLYYIKTFFFPIYLSFDQQWVVSSLSFSQFYLPLGIDLMVIITGIIIGVFIYHKKSTFFFSYLFFSLWFLVGILFHLQIFPLDATVGDRWFYVPMIGLLGMLGIVFQILINNYKKLKPFFLLLNISIVLIFSIRTIIRNNDWRDPIALYTHDIRISDNYDLENSLGTEYQMLGNNTLALIHFQHSVSQRPYEYNLHNLGVTYAGLENIVMAKKYFSLALYGRNYHLFTPHLHDVSTYKSYASVLLYYDDNQTTNFLHTALVDYPDDSDLWMLLSLARLQNKDMQGALRAAQKAYQLNPNQQDRFIYEHVLGNQAFTINLYNKNILYE